mmetsp:Transcript_43637/g.57827  ORF Transcript_43637/g.57827 Transcript_43637/m.57827 type:complete len:210 (+) Transcript_43637:1238-1867(+)
MKLARNCLSTSFLRRASCRKLKSWTKRGTRSLRPSLFAIRRIWICKRRLMSTGVTPKHVTNSSAISPSTRTLMVKSALCVALPRNTRPSFGLSHSTRSSSVRLLIPRPMKPPLPLLVISLRPLRLPTTLPLSQLTRLLRAKMLLLKNQLLPLRSRLRLRLKLRLRPRPPPSLKLRPPPSLKQRPRLRPPLKLSLKLALQSILMLLPMMQ